MATMEPVGTSEVSTIERLLNEQEKHGEETVGEVNEWVQTQLKVGEAHTKLYHETMKAYEDDIANKQEANSRYLKQAEDIERTKLQRKQEIDEAVAGVEEHLKVQKGFPEEKKRVEKEVQMLRAKLSRRIAKMAKDAQDVQNSDEKLLHALHGYEKSLGLTIEKDPELTFTFTKISKVAPEAAYQVKIILDDKKDQYKVVAYDPEIKRMDVLTAELEKTQDLKKFLCGFRKQLKAQFG